MFPLKPRSIVSLLLLLVTFAYASAQNNNPYQSIGKKGKILTLSKGQYEELFDQDSIQQIGTALVNIRQMKVVKLLENEQEAQRLLDNSTTSRFLSVDPLASKFPTLTPYQYASNSPISSIDLDGLEALPFTEKNQYNEKQVFEVTTGWTDAFVTTSETKKEYPSGAKPVTQNMNQLQICRLAVARMLVPGQIKIADDQYLDEAYFKAEQRVNHYLSILATSTMTNTKEMRALTSEIHSEVISNLFNDDLNTANASVEQIERRTSFWGSRNIASDAVLLLSSPLTAWARTNFSMAKAFTSLGIPKGFGILADAPKFRTGKITLNEQLAMQEAISGGGTGTRTEIIKGMTGDPRVKGLDISKFSYNKKILDANGKVIENIEIHYLKNNKTGVTFDYKFK